MLPLTYYYREACSLCPPFLAIVESVINRSPFKSRAQLSKINIDADELALAKYSDKIPVLEIDGRLAFKYHIDNKSLEIQLVKVLNYKPL